jgi:membrane protein
VTGLKARLAGVPVARRVVGMQERYGEVRGNTLAAAVTFQAFVALFPLILVIVGVVGFVSVGSSTDVAGKIISNLGLTGEGARAIRDAVTAAERSRQAASAVGLVGLFWTALGLINALQYAYGRVWNLETRGLRNKVVGLGWLLGAALIFAIGAAITAAVALLPTVFAPLGIVLALGVNFVLWLWTAKVLPNRVIGLRPLVPGALLGAVGMEVLKIVGGIYVPRVVTHSSELYGSLGVVFAILAWLLFFGRLIVYSAALNVVLYEKTAGSEP